MKESDFNRDQSINDNSGFVVPDGYFDKLKSVLLERTSSSGFETPDGYFDSLPGRITARILAEKKVIPLVPEYSTLIKVASGIAAALVISTGLYLGFGRQESFDTAQLNTLTDEEIINYMEPADINDSRLMEIAIKNNGDTYKNEIHEEQLIIDEL